MAAKKTNSPTVAQTIAANNERQEPADLAAQVSSSQASDDQKADSATEAVKATLLAQKAEAEAAEAVALTTRDTATSSIVAHLEAEAGFKLSAEVEGILASVAIAELASTPIDQGGFRKADGKPDAKGNPPFDGKAFDLWAAMPTTPVNEGDRIGLGLPPTTAREYLYDGRFYLSQSEANRSKLVNRETIKTARRIFNQHGQGATTAALRKVKGTPSGKAVKEAGIAAVEAAEAARVAKLTAADRKKEQDAAKKARLEATNAEVKAIEADRTNDYTAFWAMVDGMAQQKGADPRAIAHTAVAFWLDRVDPTKHQTKAFRNLEVAARKAREDAAREVKSGVTRLGETS